ncbi:MAG: DUF547 domain-containing protein [Sedimentisphaerales bacterium]|nr:DUF547 domain-containing protein [Sedimentisphaerales bacterium]
MARRSLAICVILGCLALLIGCAGTAGPQDASPALVAPVEPNAVALAEPAPAVPEPNDVEANPGPGPQDANDAPEPNDVDVAAVVAEAAAPTAQITEPNVVEIAEPNAPEIDIAGISEAAPPQAAVEPNDAVADEPNEPAVVEIEPEKQEVVAPGQAAALPAFVEEYTGILQDYVRPNGRVDYSTLRRRRLQLKQLLMQLDELDPEVYAGWPQEAKLAFWINAYNLKMLETITRNYPIESSWWLRLTWPPSDIRHIKGIWTDYKFIVMDEEFTLTAVERRFFRKAFDDPRAYLAVTYATRSSPRLRRGPYLGADLDEQLDEQVSGFLSDPKGFRIDRAKKTVSLSALFKPNWRGREFVARYATDKKFKDRPPETRAVLNFITKYLAREDVYFLETENYTLEYMNFDWRINDTSRGF